MQDSVILCQLFRFLFLSVVHVILCTPHCAHTVKLLTSRVLDNCLSHSCTMFSRSLSPLAMCFISVSKRYTALLSKYKYRTLTFPTSIETKANESVSTPPGFSAALYLNALHPPASSTSSRGAGAFTLTSWTDFVFRLLVTFIDSIQTKHCHQGLMREALNIWIPPGLNIFSYSSTSDYQRFCQGLICDPLIDLIQLVQQFGIKGLQ